MRAPKSIERWALYLACLGLVIPHQLLQAEQPQHAVHIADVALDAEGMLHGRVMTADGHSLPGTEVFLVREGSTPLQVTTNERGEFHLASLQGGVYHLHAAGESHLLRVWAAQTAPPAALQGVTLVANDVVRGQNCTTGSCTGIGGCGGGMWGFLTNPWVIGAAVAAAIAIPLALSGSSSDDDTAS